ncbi:MAG: NAD(P)/FAD-dependent oxidoreductase, partial [Nonomuraea sp.]|nr:NAD(P)/FAD-dependent oxidoreductase [Nonomuraea sp.]
MSLYDAVVGAGPAGLATAYALDRAGCSVRVFEAAGEVGGRMRTLRARGCLIDSGAEMLPSKAGYPATWRLIEAVGM